MGADKSFFIFYGADADGADGRRWARMARMDEDGRGWARMGADGRGWTRMGADGRGWMGGLVGVDADEAVASDIDV